MIVSKRWASAYPESVKMAINYSLGASGSLVLCSGVIPSDSVMAGLTSASSVITSAALATFAMYGAAITLMDVNAQPPQFELTSYPSVRTATATAAGTATWAALYGSYFLGIVDVSLPNQGGFVQVDNTTLSVGTVVTLLGISFSIWR